MDSGTNRNLVHIVSILHAIQWITYDDLEK